MNSGSKRQGRKIAAAVLVILALTAPGVADTKPAYDKRIEEAAIRTLIPKLGDMRGSLDLKSNEYLRPLTNRQAFQSKAAEAPAPRPLERSKGSFLFF